MICGLGSQGPATAKGFIGEWCSVDDRYIPIGDYEGACHKAIIKRNSFEEHEAYCHILRVLENWTEPREIGSRVVAQCEGEGEVHMGTLEFVTQKVFYTLRVGMMGGNDDEKASCDRCAATEQRHRYVIEAPAELTREQWIAKHSPTPEVIPASPPTITQ